MKTKGIYWLQIKVFIGLGTLLLGSALIVLYLELISQENHANQQLLSHVRQLEVLGKSIQRRGITYAENAPRDYGPYQRDVVIFYPDFRQDLDAFENQISLIADSANHMPRTIISPSNNRIINSVNNLQSQWNSFNKGLVEKLGPNTKEPRLEWGADYVKEKHKLINSITGMLITTIDTAIQEQLEANKKFTSIVIGGAGTLLLLGVVWFYFSVIRRITSTVMACQRVAQGDFGYQLPTNRNDELGALARAFNTLSSRTRLVVTMLTNMHRHGSMDNKIDSLWNEAGAYLPIQWLGLFELDPSENILTLMTTRTERKLSDTLKKTLNRAANTDQHLLAISKSSTPVKFDNLANVATQIPNAKLAREMLKVGLLNSALFVPLTSDDGWKGLIVFIAQEAAAYTDEQVELMGNLAPFMANGFAQAETIPAAPDKFKVVN
jgi:methyl-accepting chemotaxis protein